MLFTKFLNSDNLFNQSVFLLIFLQASQNPNLSNFKLGLVSGNMQLLQYFIIKYYFLKNFTLIILNKNLPHMLGFFFIFKIFKIFLVSTNSSIFLSLKKDLLNLLSLKLINESIEQLEAFFIFDQKELYFPQNFAMIFLKDF